MYMYIHLFIICIVHIFSIIFNRNLTVKAINRSIASRVVFGSTPLWKAKACASFVPSSQTSIATYDHVELRKLLS